MDVRCEKCGTEYEFDEDRIGPSGVTVKCTACSYVFKVRKTGATPAGSTTTVGKGPQGREWLVRKPDTQMIAFRELTTLQKWIVEGRINRDDEISKNGETWKRLGNILELEPFFSVYEKAQALNELIEKGGAEGERVELRGSEVVASLNPVNSLGLDSPGEASTARPAASLSDAFAAAPSASAFDARLPGPAPEGDGIPVLLKPGVRANGITHADGYGPTERGPERRPPSRSTSGVKRTSPTPPPSWRGGSLSVPLDDDLTPSSDVVERFKRQQRARRLAVGCVFLLVSGATAVVLVAKFGPDGNPLRVLGERYALIPPKVKEDTAARSLEEAQQLFDLDTLVSLEKAESLFQAAEATRPNDARVRGDHALVMITRADALRRAAADQGETADEIERAALPNTPTSGPGSPATLRAQMTKNTEAASALMKSAFEIAAQAYKSSPEMFEPARALAEYYRVQRDLTSFGREFARAKMIVEKTGANDPALLYIESAAIAMSTQAKPEDLAKSGALAEQALSIRPSMNRARTLLARTRIARGAFTEAGTELDKVLASAPDHEEALRLKALIARRTGKAAPDAPPASETKRGAEALPPGAPGGSALAGAQVEPPAAPAPSEAAAAQAAPPEAQPATAEAPKTEAPKTEAPKTEAPKAEEAAAVTPPEAGEAEAKPRSYEELLREGDRHRERDRPRRALAAYEKAADLRPGSAEPLAGMGWSYIDLDKPQAALNMFKRAARTNERYAEAYFGQAEAYKLLGDKANAIALYQQYLQRSPRGADRKAAERAIEQLSK